MKRRILSSLMALVLVFGLLPVSAMAEASDWDPLTNPDNVYGSLDTSRSYNKQYSTTFTIGAGIGQLKAMPILDTSNASYNAMAYCGAKAVSSDPDVVEVNTKDGHQDIVIGKWQGGDWDGADCLQVNVNPKKAGTARVTITFYCTFSQSDNPLTNRNTVWVRGTCTYTVKVVDPDANKPAKPGKSAIDSFWELSTGCAVRLDCDRVEDHYALYVRSNDGNNNLSYWGNYELGEVVANPGNLGMRKDNYPWVCPMTIDASGFLEYYNYGYPGHEGYAKTEGVHMLADGQEDPTVYWFWDKKDNIWKFNPSDAPVEIEITCPALPGEDDIIDGLGENAVKVECETDSTKHPAKSYELTKDSLTIPELPSWSDSKGYYIEVAVAADDYVDDYETAYGNHTLKNESPQTITLYYDKDTPKWSPSDDATAPYVTFEVKHEVTPPAPTAPTEDELAQDPAFGVELKCVTNSKEHGPFDTKVVKGTFTIGEVAGNAQDGYTCEVIIRTDPYVTSDVYVNHCNGVKHTAVAEKVGALLRYNTDEKTWEVVRNKDGVAATIETMCKTESTTVNVVIKPVDSEENEIDGALVRSTDFGAINAADNRFHVGYLTTTQTLSDQTADPEGDGLEESNPVKAFVYQQMAKGDETWHPADGVEQKFTWARQIRFTDLKRESDGTYTLTGQIMFYKLTLDLDGGKLNSGDAAVTYYLSGSEAELPEPSKTGYTFAGWEYKEEDPGDGGVIVMSANEQDNDPAPELTPAGTPIEINYDEEYIARWTVNQYTITFDTDGGTKIDPITQDYGTPVTRPANPTKSGYTFAGWNKTIPSAMPAENMTITALWRSNTPDKDKDDDYTLKYVTSGGKVISSETKSRSWVKDYEDLPTPIRSGYRFEGWYYDTRLTDKVTDDVKVNKTVVTLYARWSSSETPGMLNDEDHFAYVQGYSDGNVHPYGLISRAETTTIFFRLLTDEVRDDNLLTSNTYTDVTNDYWANTAISTMTGLGIVQGRSATTFDPKAPITRAQFAAICARFDTGVSSGSRTFSDISGHWAEKYIERAAELGWIQGFADGTFRPDTYITRAQAMTMINRVLNRTPEDEEDLLEGMKVWPDCNPGDWFYLAVQEATNSHDYKDRGGEVWTKLTRDPDWTRYEH